MPMSPRQRRQQYEAARAGEPLILWWMPVVALLAPIIASIWTAATADSDAIGKALIAIVWPGLPLYAVVVAVLWGGWKIELE
jgi:hypothetical protein